MRLPQERGAVERRAVALRGRAQGGAIPFGFHRRYREGIAAYHATEVPREQQVQFRSSSERRAKLAFVQGEHRGSNIVMGDAASESGSSVASEGVRRTARANSNKLPFDDGQHMSTRHGRRRHAAPSHTRAQLDG